MHRLAIANFTFHQIRRGALTFAVLATVLLLVQGIGIKAALPTPAERAQMIASFESNPVFTFMYGENDHADTPAGYMTYRSGQILALVGGLWALLFATKTLRGQEEDGRLELLLVGRTTLGMATAQLLTGILAGIGLVGVLVFAGLLGAPTLGVDLRPAAALWIALGYTGILTFFSCLGMLTSQLAASRRQAVLYGIAPLILFFIARSLGNSVPQLYWLKDITPFGWFDHLRPIVDAQPMWLLPLYLAGLVFALAALAIAYRRDLGSAVMSTSTTARPRYFLLKGPFGLAVRLTRGPLMGWGLAIMSLAAVVASVAQTAADALRQSSGLSKGITQIAHGGPDLAVVFLSVGSMIIATLLLAMIANGMGTLREEETRGQTDNLFVRQVSRQKWLLQRSIFLFGVAALYICLAATTVWFVAKRQAIDLAWGQLVLDDLAILGIIGLFIGVGVALYGWLSRKMTIVMYALLIWSFVGQLLTSITTNQAVIDSLTKTSLLHYVDLAPASSPDWGQFCLLLLSGIGLTAIGVAGFKRRDIQTE